MQQENLTGIFRSPDLFLLPLKCTMTKAGNKKTLHHSNLLQLIQQSLRPHATSIKVPSFRLYPSHSCLLIELPFYSPPPNMSRRTGATVVTDQDQNHVDAEDPTAKSQEKQIMLLAQDTGHFSLIKYAPSESHA